MKTTTSDYTSYREQLAVTYREAADRLSLSERSVWSLVKRGELRAVRIGRAVRVPVRELERFLSNEK